MGGCAKTAANFCGGLVIYIVGVITDWSGVPKPPPPRFAWRGRWPARAQRGKAGRRGWAAGYVTVQGEYETDCEFAGSIQKTGLYRINVKSLRKTEFAQPLRSR